MGVCNKIKDYEKPNTVCLHRRIRREKVRSFSVLNYKQSQRTTLTPNCKTISSRAITTSIVYAHSDC